MQIEKTTKIGELLDTNPEKAELLLSVGIVSIVFHIPILCGTLAIGLGVLSMKNGRKVFSTIGIILGAIGIVLTAAITINVLSFVASSSLTFIIWKVKTKNKLKLIV